MRVGRLIAIEFLVLVCCNALAWGQDDSVKATFGFHDRDAGHWKGGIHAACAGTNNLYNPLDDKTELVTNYPGTQVTAGDLVENWNSPVDMTRIEVLEWRDVRGVIELRLFNASGAQVGVLTNALGVYEATTGTEISELTQENEKRM